VKLHSFVGLSAAAVGAESTTLTEKGSWPEVMCATEDGLEQRALYGPTGRMKFVGPVGMGTLHPHGHDKPVMERLWELSEKETGMEWGL
jgi:hypothetical protein